MPNELENIIKDHIHRSGPMDIATFMNYCLAHPQYGYYTTRDPFGVTGDFVTAPEISQLFGEMIGIYIRAFYESLHNPSRLYVVECGAGRGTMMRDILRVIVPHIDVSVHIVEISKPLREIQQNTIGRADITWHDDISTLPNDGPIFIVGNEFLDALPIHQAININDKWHEHCVGLVKDELQFVAGSPLHAANLPDAHGRKIFEYSPRREAIHSELCARIQAQKGCLLWIDYGFERGENRASLQAVKDHHYADVLGDIGNADLTSLVDFEALIHLVPKDCEYIFQTQSEFLKSCGIDMRCNILSNKNKSQAESLSQGYHRLVDDDQMGHLFKVLSVSKT